MNVKWKFCIQIAGGGLIAHQHNFINKHWEIADKMDIVFKYSKWISYSNIQNGYRIRFVCCVLFGSAQFHQQTLEDCGQNGYHIKIFKMDILYKLLYVVYYLDEIFIPLTLPPS